MATKRAHDQPHFSIVVLHDADTGRRVAISAMWLTTFEETERGTVFKFLNGDRVRVEETLDAVIREFCSVGEAGARCPVCQSTILLPFLGISIPATL